MVDDGELAFDAIAEESAVMRTYQQVFAILALESEKMVSSSASIDINEAIFETFADADSEGLTESQICARCRAFPEKAVRRRLAVLESYGAVGKVFDRRMERYYRATFPPYVMLLFLRRLAEQGGMAELHRMLSASRQELESGTISLEAAADRVRENTYLLRLLANQLAGLATSADVSQLRANAQLVWGNQQVIDDTRWTCQTVPHRFPELLRPVQRLRSALAAYTDAIEAAAARMLDRAANTQGLGFLPLEVWDSFVKRSSVAELAEPLAGFVFDAVTAWFEPNDLVEAVESAEETLDSRTTPPRGDEDDAVAEEAMPEDRDAAALTAAVEEVLAGRDELDLPQTLRSFGDWRTARRVLSDLTAAHHHPDLPYLLEWGDTLAIAATSVPAWATTGTFRRITAEARR